MTKYDSNMKLIFFLVVILIFGSMGCGEESASPAKESTGTKIVVKKTQAAAPATETAAKEIPAVEASAKEDAADASANQEEELAAQKAEGKAVEMLYDPTGKINPFAPLFEEDQIQHDIDLGQSKKDSGKKTRLFVSPLEKVDLTQLKLTGVILSQKGNKALVEETNQKGYVVTVGTYIGVRQGRISKIERDRIIVDEVDVNELGKEYIKKNELKLQKPPGEF